MRRTEHPQLRRAARRWYQGGLVVALATALFAAVGVAAAQAAPLARDDFEDGNAAGWVTTGGTWVVTRENTRVLRQSSFGADALARTGQPGWRDYSVTTTVTPDSFNGMPGFAGVAARVSSSTSYYALVLRPDDTVALVRTINGTTSTLAATRLAVSEDTSYTLTLRVTGQRLTGRVNGTQLTASDGFLTTGLAGLVTKWTTASFDNVSVDTN